MAYFIHLLFDFPEALHNALGCGMCLPGNIAKSINCNIGLPIGLFGIIQNHCICRKLIPKLRDQHARIDETNEVKDFVENSREDWIGIGQAIG